MTRIDLSTRGRRERPSRWAPLAAAFVAAGCAASDAPPVTRGEALFLANCAECHGERALGDGPLASTLPVAPPSLLEHLGHHPMAQLVSIIRTGVPPAMPPAPLTEEQVLQVIDYAWTLVPDSLVDELRAMQRMAEMGMDMGGMNMGGAPGTGAEAGGMHMNDAEAGGVVPSPDSAGR